MRARIVSGSMQARVWVVGPHVSDPRKRMGGRGQNAGVWSGEQLTRGLRVGDTTCACVDVGRRHMTGGDHQSVPAVGWRTVYMGRGLRNSAHEHSRVSFSLFLFFFPVLFSI
jgi:hypothetical protein